MFKIAGKVVTPKLSGSILDGITRRSGRLRRRRTGKVRREAAGRGRRAPFLLDCPGGPQGTRG